MMTVLSRIRSKKIPVNDDKTQLLQSKNLIFDLNLIFSSKPRIVVNLSTLDQVDSRKAKQIKPD